MEYKLQKAKIPAQVALRGKRLLRGSFFVMPPAYAVPDQDLLVRLLNESEEFIPFEKTKQITLLNKHEIQYVKVPLNKQNVEDGAGIKRKIRILLMSQQELDGTIAIDLPPERQRVLDFLNLKTLFFVLKSAKEFYLVNKTIVQGIIPRDKK